MSKLNIFIAILNVQISLYLYQHFHSFDRILIDCFSPGMSNCQPLVKCKRVFQALINIAVEELCEIANSLIAPVRLGAARPTAPFSLAAAYAEAVHVREWEFFCVLCVIL